MRVSVFFRMKTTTYVKMGCMAVVTAMLSACGLDMPQEKQTSYETLVVQKSDITVPLKYSARMNGKSDVTITPQINGQLMRKCIGVGEDVKAGQTLFIIDDRQARLDLEDAQANLQSALAQEKSAQLEYESNKNLFEKHIVSSYMLSTAENSYNQAKAAVAQARSAVNRAQVTLGYYTIKSPISGIVGTIPAKEGMQIAPGIELATISANKEMNATFSVTEAEMTEVLADQKGNDIKAYIESLPEVTFLMKDGTEYEHKGVIKTVTGVVNSSTGTVSCDATFPNPNGLLVPGVQGTVVLPYGVKDVIVIPQCAVVRLQDKSMVYKVGADSCAVGAIVTTVDAGTGKDFVVTSGLKPGDKIVTVGANNVIEGQKVLFPEETKK